MAFSFLVFWGTRTRALWYLLDPISFTASFYWVFVYRCVNTRLYIDWWGTPYFFCELYVIPWSLLGFCWFSCFSSVFRTFSFKSNWFSTWKPPFFERGVFLRTIWFESWLYRIPICFFEVSFPWRLCVWVFWFAIICLDEIQNPASSKMRDF